MPNVATCLLINDYGKLLILKRSNAVRTYKGLWGGVAGYIEENEEPYETAIKEIREEVGLEKDKISLIKQLDPIEFTDSYNGKVYDWKIFSFLFKIEKKSKIIIDWEHLEYRWIPPLEIEKYDTVPYLKEIVSKLLL
jgi:8-oxo-dGTP pyrophosphatase MutT (NUDIX family)